MATKSTTLKKHRFIRPSTRENMRLYWYRFRRNKLSVIGLIIVLITILIAILGPVISPHPGHAKEFVDFQNANQAPSSQYFFGTDTAGRDIFSRCLISFRGALIMAIVVLAISVPFGTILGLIAGYYHHTWIDSVIMRIADVFLAIPPLILALAIASMLEPNMMNSMLAVTVMWWPWYTRLVYGTASSVSEEYFVKNAELIGASKAHILFREILPHCMSPVLTKVALDVGWVILMGASLSFAGLGEQPPTPAFGQMISDGAKYLPDMWWMTIMPALCVIFIILGFNFLGDGIRDMFSKKEG